MDFYQTAWSPGPSHFLPVLVGFVNLKQTRVIYEEETSTEMVSLLVDKSGAIFLTNGRCGRTQATVGRGVLGRWSWKPAGQAVRSKALNNIPPPSLLQSLT